MSAEPVGRLGVVVPSAARRARVLTLDGIEVCRTSVDALKSLALREGDLSTHGDLAHAIEAAEPEAAMNRALRLLGHRERSRAELFKRLAEDGYSDDVATSVCERLSSIGYLDDARFAEEYARSKRSAGWGRRRIADGLARKGIDGDVAGSALDAHVKPEGEVDRASAMIGGIDTTDRRSRERALRRLVSRGFSYETARAAIERSADGDAGR